MRRILIGIGVVLVVAVAAAAGLAYQAAGERDDQRVRDLQTIRGQLTAPGTTLTTALPEAAPRPARPEHPYIYALRDGQFMACTTFERQDAGRALFVTAAGEFRTDRQQCQPTFDPRIAGIILDAKLTDAGIGPFLAAAPELADAATVKAQCRTAGPDEVLFGCYLPTNKIWILDVNDPALPHLTTVAAVHELLHALEPVDPPPPDQLKAAAAQIDDPLLSQELSFYEEAERDSELDARLGTEYAGLPSGLESYYGRYFDRAAVVGRYQAYGQLVRQVNSLRGLVDAERGRLDALRSSGQIAAYNARVDTYNALVRRYNELADRYNLVGE